LAIFKRFSRRNAKQAERENAADKDASPPHAGLPSKATGALPTTGKRSKGALATDIMAGGASDEQPRLTRAEGALEALGRPQALAATPGSGDLDLGDPGRCKGRRDGSADEHGESGRDARLRLRALARQLDRAPSRGDAHNLVALRVQMRARCSPYFGVVSQMVGYPSNVGAQYYRIFG
jgi:hypothetical protein